MHRSSRISITYRIFRRIPRLSSITNNKRGRQIPVLKKKKKKKPSYKGGATAPLAPPVDTPMHIMEYVRQLPIIILTGVWVGRGIDSLIKGLEY